MAPGVPLVLGAMAMVATSAQQPAPPLGQWSAAHSDSWCDKGKLVADMGKGVTLSACKQVMLTDINITADHAHVCARTLGCSYEHV